MCATDGGSGVGFQCHSPSDSVEPTGQGSLFADRANFLGEYQEGGLKSIFSVLLPSQHPPANAVHHWAVAKDDGLERGMVASQQRPFQQLPIG